MNATLGTPEAFSIFGTRNVDVAAVVVELPCMIEAPSVTDAPEIVGFPSGVVVVAPEV